MRATKSMILLTALLALCLTGLAFAQTSTSNTKPQLITKMSPDSAQAMMVKMSENYKAMEKDLTELEHHMQTMINIKDMDKLQPEMQKHMTMMRSVDKMMVEQHRMVGAMMGWNRMTGKPMMERMPPKTMEMKKPETTQKEKKD
jgi:hypothetical protein